MKKVVEVPQHLSLGQEQAMTRRLKSLRQSSMTTALESEIDQSYDPTETTK